MIVTINNRTDFNKIINSGQCFRPSLIADDTYRFIKYDRCVIIKDLGGGKCDVSCDREEWDTLWRGYFDLWRDYDLLADIIPRNDMYMAKCYVAGSGIRILNQNKYEMLISFIISQRKSIPAIRSSIEKLCDRYGDDIEGMSVKAFPSPKALSEASFAELKECGLGYRIPYVSDAAKAVYTKEFDPEAADDLSDEDLFSELKTLNGVGDKVANCVMLFGYHRTGRAPVDTWIKKVIDEVYGGVDPFPGYGEYAGIMQQYVFYNAQHLKN